MDDFQSIKVVLRTAQGQYLAGHQDSWSLTPERERAKVFDYLADRIAHQLEILQKTSGIVWMVVPVDPRERSETCDVCGQRAFSFKIYFDGRQYLCAECRKTAAQKH